MREYPKKTKKLLREFQEKAYEEEMRRELIPLFEAFRRWEKGLITSLELSDLIHEFNRGPARLLFSRYSIPGQDLMVARAIAVGLIKKDGVPRDLLEEVRDLIEFSEKELGKRAR